MKKNNILNIAVLTVLYSSTVFANEISTNSALMQSMDKVTGRVKQITVPVNSQITYGDFSLVLRACKKRPAEETPENFAFIDVADKSLGDKEYNIFKGWILSSTPGINAIEHPIYDVWLLECVDTDVSKAKLLTSEELEKRDTLPQKDSLIESTVQDNDEIESMKSNQIQPQKTIRIKDFIQEDKDIEQNIITTPQTSAEQDDKTDNMIKGNSSEPENLLDFAKDNSSKDADSQTDEDNTTEEIDLDSEIYY